MMAVGFEEAMPRSGITLMMSSAEVIGERVLAVAGKLDKDEIVLDNGSTINLFGNGKLLTNQTLCNPISVSGVGGDIKTSHCGLFARTMRTYNHDGVMANVLSQARVEDLVKSVEGASLAYNEETLAFELNIPKVGNWVFQRRDDLGGLRVAKATPESAFITVAENRKKYTKRELKGADDARELLRRANFPSDKALAHLVNSGNLLNSPVTSSDIHRATKIDGGDKPSAMGKATKAKPKVFSEEPSTATVNKNVHLEGDIFFVDSEAFLLTVSNFGYGMGAYLGNEHAKGTRSAGNIWKYLSLMLSAYVAYGFNVESFSCDRESGIMVNKDNIEARGTKFNPKASDAKCPRAERRIRTCKDRDRCTRPSLAFKLFGTILVYSVLNCLRCINLFPCTASPHVAPREVFSGIRCDFKRDFPVAFGDYCLTYDTGNKIINSSRRRMEECIALLPIGNKDGDVHFYNLRSGQIITRNGFKVYPTPDSIIDHLNNAYDKATKRDYSLPPVYRTAHHNIDDDGPLDNMLEMEAPSAEEIPMYGRHPDLGESVPPEPPDEDSEPDHSPVRSV